MSIEPTDLEKKSLEAHVDLCAERYKNLDERFSVVVDQMEKLDSTMTDKMEKMENCLHGIRDMMSVHIEKHNDRIISYMGAGIATLIAALGFLIVEYVL